MSTARSLRSGWPLLTLAACALGAVTLGWLAWQERAAGLRTRETLRAKLAERDWVAAQNPSPSDTSEQQIRAELAAVERSIGVLAKLLAGPATGALEVTIPAKPVDAYFELAAYAQKQRALAVAARTAVSDDERFGFATHVAQGPAEELLPVVARQAAALRLLLECLLQASPRELLAVQRERPLTAEQWAERRAGRAPRPAKDSGGPGASADFFALDPALSLLVPGETDTMAFRVEFSGHTASLRGFLNSLATSPAPFFVRSVEVEPLASSSPAGAAVEADAAQPVVAQNVSKFAVVVELVELLRRPTNP